MKKTVSLAAFLLLFSLSIFAQAGQTSKISIDIAAGCAIPVGDFASKNLNSNSSGLADPGEFLHFSLAYRQDPHYSIIGIARLQRHSCDVSGAPDVVKNAYPGYNFTTTVDDWLFAAGLFGIQGTVELTPGKAFLDAKAAVGFIAASSPENSIRGGDGVNSISFSTASSNAISYSYLLGLDYRYRINEKVDFLVNLDYFGADPGFTNVTVSSSNGKSANGSYSQSIGTLNLSAGLSIPIQ